MTSSEPEPGAGRTWVTWKSAPSLTVHVCGSRSIPVRSSMSQSASLSRISAEGTHVPFSSARGGEGDEAVEGVAVVPLVGPGFLSSEEDGEVHRRAEVALDSWTGYETEREALSASANRGGHWCEQRVALGEERTGEPGRAVLFGSVAQAGDETRRPGPAPVPAERACQGCAERAGDRRGGWGASRSRGPAGWRSPPATGSRV